MRVVRDLSPRAYQWSVWGLVALRVAAVGALCWWLPPEQQFWRHAYEHNEAEYFRVAQGLAHGTPVSSFRTIGFPLTLVPWIWLLRATTFDALVTPVMLFQSVVLGTGIVWLIADIVRCCSGRRWPAFLAVVGWTCLPVLAYVWGMHVDPAYHFPDMRWHRLGHLLSLRLSSDTWNLVWALLAVWAVARTLADGPRWRWGVLAGCGVGAATLTMVPSVTLAALWCVWWRTPAGRRCLCVAALVAVMVSGTQRLADRYTGEAGYAAVWHNQLQIIVEESPALDPATPPWSVTNWARSAGLLSRKYRWPLLVVFLLLAGVAARGWTLLLRRASPAAWLVMWWMVPFGLTYAGYWAFDCDPCRLLLPIVPAVLCLMAIAIDGWWHGAVS